MFAYCDVCHYQTEDYDNKAGILLQIEKDGGKVDTTQGQEKEKITCPEGHSDEHIHID